jgi:bacillithiol synthase
MKSECLPFSQIPHTTKLFTDFLSYSPAIRSFYPRSPFLTEWLLQQNTTKSYDPERRQRVSDLLEAQNRAFGASEKTHENIQRFRAGASVLVTGQQVGLLGGPLFSIFKALTAVKLADEATKAGVPCVPVFWLATEDHDLAEVSETAIPDRDDALTKLSLSAAGTDGAPVGTIRFGTEIDSVVNRAAELLGNVEIADLLRDCYRAGETFGSAFAKLFARLFADSGVILLQAGDPAIDRLVESLYRAAIEKSGELDRALLDRGRELEASGYHQQVKVTPSSTLLFALQDGKRVPIHRTAANSADADAQFSFGNTRVSADELLATIHEQPENFSANVLLRPVIQDYLLPTLAYTGGSAEVAYFAQAAVVYETLLGRVTPIIPRFSATLVEPKPQRLLDKYSLGLTDIFRGPDALNQTLAARALPGDVQSAFAKARERLDASLHEIREALTKLDVTLVDAAKNTSEKMHHQLEQLRARAARAELRQTEVLTRHAQVLNDSLYPNKSLQEREIAGIYFLAQHGQGLLTALYDAIRTDCLDHQVIQI